MILRATLVWTCGLLAIAAGPAAAGQPSPVPLAARVQGILKANCYRCHGEDGTAKGGMDYILDRDRLVARAKIVPGKAADSLLFKKVLSG